MRALKGRLTVIYRRGKKRMVVKAPITGDQKVVVVINSQFTNAPNTTQIASGAGRSSAAGNDAAIASSNVLQQQSVGAGGKAKNTGMRGQQTEWHGKQTEWRGKQKQNHDGKIAVVVINDQVVKQRRGKTTTSSATQVAGGAGRYSASGTNAAIESSNVKQQHAVGGGPGSRAINKGQNNRQNEGVKGVKRAKKVKRANSGKYRGKNRIRK